MILRTTVVAVAAALSIAACSGPSKSMMTGQGNVDLVSYDDTVAASQADVAAVRQGLRAFSWDLFAAQREQGQDLWLSPASVQAVLTMVLAATDGASHKELQQALHLDSLPDDRLYPAVSVLWREITDTEQYRTDVVNWGVLKEGVTLTDSFKDTVGRYLGANISEADYNDVQALVDQINTAVAENTEGMITEIITPDDISVGLFLMLLNTVYFQGTWVNQFHPDRTQDRDFTTWTGETGQVPTMRAPDVSTQGAKGPGWTARILPYEGGAEMLIILPDEGKFEAVTDQLNPQFLDQLDQTLSETTDDIVMPKFEYATSRLDLEPAMQQLGATSMFKASGDWAPLTGPQSTDEQLAFLYHKAAIKVDEAGTEASAVTVAGVEGVSGRRASEPFVVDRPFITIIRDTDTRTPLFIGQFGDLLAQ